MGTMNMATSECVRDLIRRQQDQLELRRLVLEGAASPRSGEADAPYFDTLRARARAPAGKASSAKAKASRKARGSGA